MPESGVTPDHAMVSSASCGDRENRHGGCFGRWRRPRLEVPMRTRTMLPALVPFLLMSACATAPATTASRTTAARDPAPAASTTPAAPTTPASEAEQRLTFSPEPVRFGLDDSQLDADAQARLRALAAHLQRSPGTRVTIVGHADERGTGEYNLSLGEARARAARDYLVRLGINASRVTITSRGEEEPAVAGSNEQAWAMNRRDEFMLVEEVATR
jgi:peptidoglycan-associated lipoprotein